MTNEEISAMLEEIEDPEILRTAAAVALGAAVGVPIRPDLRSSTVEVIRALVSRSPRSGPEIADLAFRLSSPGDLDDGAELWLGELRDALREDLLVQRIRLGPSEPGEGS